jgi:serine/threonine-protein kinase
VAGNAAPSSDQVNTVYLVSPSGRIDPTQLLTLTFYSDQVAMPTPSAPSLEGTVATASTVQVRWDGYSCPAGSGSPSSYDFTATNGTFPATGQSTASFAAGDRSGDLLITGAEGQTVIVTYTVTCSGNGSTRPSPASGEANAQIQAASTPAPGGANPTPTPTP